MRDRIEPASGRPDPVAVDVTIIDLGTGNLGSVTRAFARMGGRVSLVATPEAAEGASVIVLPGVGAFGPAMNQLRARGFEPLLRRHALQDRKPLIGICLGMQLLAERSHEHELTEGLGFIPGEVLRLQPEPPQYQVPNIGWVEVRAVKPTPMFPPGVDGASFYHVHSYHLVCRDRSDIAATACFGKDGFVSAVQRDNVFGMQFHPEKSQDAGLDLLHSLLADLAKAGAV